MHELPCEVVRDLLPSYVDGLTSETTSRLVDEHIETCEPCRAALDAMRAPEEQAENGGEEKPIDYLKKNRRHNRKVLLGSLAGALMLIVAVLFSSMCIVGEELTENSAWWQLRVEGNRLSVNLSAADSARVVKKIAFSESDGVVTLSARAVLVSFLYPAKDCAASYTASAPIRRICMGSRILWDDGEDISRMVSAVYQTRHDYIGDMPANGRTANALNLSRYLGAYQNELLTAERPYVWKLLLQQDVPESRRALKESEMEAFGCVLLATVGNLDEVRYEYTVDGAAAEKSVTAADATALFGHNIKDCGDSPRLLQKLMQLTGVAQYLFDVAEFRADVAEADTFWIEASIMTDGVKGVGLALLRNGEVYASQGVTKANDSLYEKGETVAFSITPEDLDERWDDVGELTIRFDVTMADGNWYETSDVLRLVPRSGGTAYVTITGNAADGFSVTQ